jgi:sorting nexin-1/2
MIKPSKNIDTNLLDLMSVQFEVNKPQEKMRGDELVKDRVIEIVGPITIHEGYFTSYKLYKLKTKKRNAVDFDTIVERRFSDFEYLHFQFLENYGGYMIPKLPEKHIWSSLDMETPEQIQSRKEKLRKYLEKVLNHKKLRVSEEFMCFLFDF